MDYKEKSREVHGCGKRICMGCAVIEAALRESAAAQTERIKNEGNCRREHGGSWADFELWMEKETAALRAKEPAEKACQDCTGPGHPVCHEHQPAPRQGGD